MLHLQYGLGIRNNRVELRYADTERQRSWEHQKRRVVTSVDDFRNFIQSRMKKYKHTADDLIIMCSSSMDFPEDSTSNKKTIALAHELR